MKSVTQNITQRRTVQSIRSSGLRIALLFLLILSSVVPAWSQGNQRFDSLSFLIVSDWGGFSSNDQKAVAAAMGKEAQRIKASFVVTAGDNYHGNGVETSTDPRCKTEYEDVYNDRSLQIPWYPSLGNHDYRGNVDAELGYSKHSERWKFPARYYAQVERIDDSTFILIVHLDTPPFLEDYRARDAEYHVKGQDIGLQIHRLDSVLTVSKTRWKMVVGHHPIYAAAPKHGDTKELIDQVLPILKKHKVPIYVCGHDHVLQHLKRDSMHFLVCGGGAEFRDVAERNDVIFGVGSLGFLSVTVTQGVLHINFVNSNGMRLHTTEFFSADVK